MPTEIEVEAMDRRLSKLEAEVLEKGARAADEIMAQALQIQGQALEINKLKHQVAVLDADRSSAQEYLNRRTGKRLFRLLKDIRIELRRVERKNAKLESELAMLKHANAELTDVKRNVSDLNRTATRSRVKYEKTVDGIIKVLGNLKHRVFKIDGVKTKTGNLEHKLSILEETVRGFEPLRETSRTKLYKEQASLRRAMTLVRTLPISTSAM